MAFVSPVRPFLRSTYATIGISAQTEKDLRQSTESFSAATALCDQTGRFIKLFCLIWQQPTSYAFQSALTCWLDLLDRDPDLRSRFRQTWKAMLGSLDFVSFFAETGLPAHHALLPEITQRFFQRLLP